jgi:flavin-dependent dehydrogenase
MMEFYDVVIIGAGIAGAGVAFNLRRLGYGGKVVIVDRDPFVQRDYDVRYTSKRIIGLYGIKKMKEYTSYRIGSNGKEFGKVEISHHVFKYTEACRDLVNRSGCIVIKETALDACVSDNILTTSGRRIRYRQLIDASGMGFFLKRKLGQRLPRHYWFGRTHILDEDSDDAHAFVSHFYDGGGLEELYPLGDIIYYGQWIYSKISGRLPEKFLAKPVRSFPGSVAPANPAFPWRCGNNFFLGDCAGQAMTASAIGIEPILDASALLAESIHSGDPGKYERVWKRKHFMRYMAQYAYRQVRFSAFGRDPSFPQMDEIISWLIERPETFYAMLDYHSKVKGTIIRRFPLLFKMGLSVMLLFDICDASLSGIAGKARYHAQRIGDRIKSHAFKNLLPAAQGRYCTAHELGKIMESDS